MALCVYDIFMFNRTRDDDRGSARTGKILSRIIRYVRVDNAVWLDNGNRNAKSIILHHWNLTVATMNRVNDGEVIEPT